MEILKKLTLKGLHLNIKRTIGTIVGIILSVALICAVSGMFTSFQASIVENTIESTGYYHLLLDGIDSEKLKDLKINRDIKDIYEVYTLGYSMFEHVAKKGEFPYLKIYSSTKEDFDNLSFKLEDGRFPTSQDEIIINTRVRNNSNYRVGDTIEIDIGKRVTLDEHELHDSNPYQENLEKLVETTPKKYKIVGIASKSGWDSRYYAITTEVYNEEIKAFLALKNPKDYELSLVSIIGAKNINDAYEKKSELDYDFSLNNELLRWEIFKFSDSTITMLYSVIGTVIFIIVITSVFCIRNSFAISTTEKMKMFGMLASVGATKKQIRKMVTLEGFYLGLIGIPIGVASGVLADFILVKLINWIINGSEFSMRLVFSISWVPILISIILGYVTIYLSSIFSAIKAGKVSPIDNMRNTKDVKLSSKKLKTPKIIKSLFKTGGELAYKNLKRSKKKYRTTVISITVSIFAFISLSSFIGEGIKQTGTYFKDYDYNISIYDTNNLQEDKLAEIKNIAGIKNTYVIYEPVRYEAFTIDDTSKIDLREGENLYGDLSISPILLDDETFKKYLEKLNLDYEYMKDKVVLADEYTYHDANGKTIYRRAYNYKKGDTIEGTLENVGKHSLKVGYVSDIKPYGYEYNYYRGGYFVTTKDKWPRESFIRTILIDSDEPDKVEKEIAKVDYNLQVINLDEQAKSERAMILIMAIFLYGFITVITLIGVTNIFNTITANMELRSKEFAMLKSIGMTKKEFNRMINLETLFYSTKSLIYGIILGIGGAYLVHRGFVQKNEMSFDLPYRSIALSILFVFIIVYLIMKYSISRIEKQNTIETIRKENI